MGEGGLEPHKVLAKLTGEQRKGRHVSSTEHGSTPADTPSDVDHVHEDGGVFVRHADCDFEFEPCLA